MLRAGKKSFCFNIRIAASCLMLHITEVHPCNGTSALKVSSIYSLTASKVFATLLIIAHEDSSSLLHAYVSSNSINMLLGIVTLPVLTWSHIAFSQSRVSQHMSAFTLFYNTCRAILPCEVTQQWGLATRDTTEPLPHTRTTTHTHMQEHEHTHTHCIPVVLC